MGRLTTLALKGLGVAVLAIIALSVLATIVGIAVSVVATIVSLIVAVAILGGLLVALGWLASFLLGERTEEPDAAPVEPTTQDPTERLQDRYVAGELTEAEFERELDRLMDGDERSRERERSPS